MPHLTPGLILIVIGLAGAGLVMPFTEYSITALGILFLFTGVKLVGGALVGLSLHNIIQKLHLPN